MSPREIPSTALQAGLAGLLLTLTLASAAGAADLAPSNAILPQVLVTAEQEKATGAVTGYAASSSATATKTDTAIAETPQSITVIGAEQIETLKAQNITDAIAYAIGGARAPYVERIGDEVMLRGFMIPTSFRDGTRQRGLYFQDQMKIASKWVLLLGGRQDKVRQKQCNYFDQSQCTVDNERSSAFTSRVGAVYLAGTGLAPFASFSQSFASLAGIDRSGRCFKPTRGEQYEAGIRYQPRGSALMLSAATYQLTQTNLLTDDPADPRYQMQQGEVRSRGVEREAKGRIGRNAQIIAAYTYTDVRTTKAGPLYPEQAGLRVSDIPYNQLSVWGDASLAAFAQPSSSPLALTAASMANRARPSLQPCIAGKRLRLKVELWLDGCQPARGLTRSGDPAMTTMLDFRWPPTVA